MNIWALRLESKKNIDNKVIIFLYIILIELLKDLKLYY